MPLKPTTLLELVGMLTERDKFFKRGSDSGYQMNMIVYRVVKINVLMQIYKKTKNLQCQTAIPQLGPISGNLEADPEHSVKDHGINDAGWEPTG